MTKRAFAKWPEWILRHSIAHSNTQRLQADSAACSLSGMVTWYSKNTSAAPREKYPEHGFLRKDVYQRLSGQCDARASRGLSRRPRSEGVYQEIPAGSVPSKRSKDSRN